VVIRGSRGSLAARADSSNAAFGQQQLVDDGVLPNLRACLPRRLDQQRVEHLSPRAVEGCRPSYIRILTGQDNTVDIESDVADRRGARRIQAIEQPPAAQPGHSRRL
jgi:hypothetical protein